MPSSRRTCCPDGGWSRRRWCTVIIVLVLVFVYSTLLIWLGVAPATVVWLVVALGAATATVYTTLDRATRRA